MLDNQDDEKFFELEGNNGLLFEWRSSSYSGSIDKVEYVEMLNTRERFLLENELPRTDCIINV